MGLFLIRFGLMFVSSGVLNWRPGRQRPPPPAAAPTRLLTRLLEEVWFPTHAGHALATSLFTSLFAGKREAAAKTPRAVEGRHALITETRAGAAGPFHSAPLNEKIQLTVCSSLFS